MKIENINIYRITHIGNIPYIIKNGITNSNSELVNKSFKNIGDISLIQRRKFYKANIDNGENNISEQIVLGDYIPFYFGVKMPMLYVIQNGGNFVPSATPAEKIVYLVCSLNKIISADKTIYFTDGHATDRLTTFYNKSKINNLPTIIDWEAIKAPYWGGNENLNIKRKKQAEIMVLENLPYDFIIGIICNTEKVKIELMKMGVNENIIKIIPKAYF